MIPQCSEFASLSEPLSPPHPDDGAAPNAWGQIAQEQLKLLDDLQERWTHLRLREAALQHEQERWADWRAREEDDLERSRAELQTWLMQESQRLKRQKAEFQAEKERWIHEMKDREQVLIKALDDLHQEGRANDEGKRRKEIAADYLASSSDERISLRRELSTLRRTLLLRDAELKRLRQQRRQKPPKSARLSRRKETIKRQEQNSLSSSSSPSADSPAAIPPSESSSISPKRRVVKRSDKYKSPTTKVEVQAKCESAPSHPTDHDSPTLRVRHVEEGNMLSIFWQGRGAPKSESLRPSSSSRLLPPSRVIHVDNKPSQFHASSSSKPPTRDIPEPAPPRIAPLLSTSSAFETEQPFSRHATVDLGEFYRRLPPPTLSSNTTEEERPIRNMRRASDILANMRSPTLQGPRRASPPSHVQSLGLSTSSSADEAEEARYKRLEEELKRRVHRV